MKIYIRHSKRIAAGLYDDVEPVKSVPSLSGMCDKVKQFKKKVSESNYDEQYLPEAEKLLKSFVSRTSAVESFMNESEKSKAKEAYTILDGIVRRYSMNKKLSDALSQAGEKISQSGYN
jgi:hypothetical protein